MKITNNAGRLLFSLLTAGLTLPALYAADAASNATANPAESQKPTFGTIVGVIRNAARLPVPGATVTATRVDGAGIRATVSGSDGIYSFADVPAGAWSVIAQAEGYRDAPTARIDVNEGRAARSDMLMAAPTTVSSLTPPPAPASLSLTNKDAGQSAPSANVANDSVWQRWAKGEKVSLRDIDKMYTARAEARQPTQTASLKPTASAFDRPAADVPDPGPMPAPQPAAAPAAPPSKLPQALEAPDPAPAVDNDTPFAFGDFTWLNGTPRNKDTVLDTKFFTPEIRFDTNYIVDFNQPIDHTMGGSTEEFRNGEVQVEQASVGGDFHWQNVRGRILFMMGMFATTTPRNDASFGVGQWDLRDAYRYVSEAYGGYHFNVNHGLNIDAGIFVSYIGLFSYYNFDNWTYQPSYVSSNTPWFFNGARLQWFPTNKLKIEPWFINGWQSYAKYNGHPGLGGQILYQPHEWLKLVSNAYGYGTDNLGLPKTQRIHSDNSVEVRFYNNQNNGMGLSKIAMSLTLDGGCQYGGGITCTGGANKSAFLGWMEYNRVWWDHDKYAITVGGGQMSNPGRYLTLLPPIDGADAVSGSPYFTELPGQKAHMWDSTVTLQYMPRQYITWWAEVGYRHSDVPYFSGRGGITPPGGNNGAPQYYTCNTGATAGTADLTAAYAACGGAGSVWFPDLRRSTSSLGVGVLVKF